MGACLHQIKIQKYLRTEREKVQTILFSLAAFSASWPCPALGYLQQQAWKDQPQEKHEGKKNTQLALCSHDMILAWYFALRLKRRTRRGRCWKPWDHALMRHGHRMCAPFRKGKLLSSRRISYAFSSCRAHTLHRYKKAVGIFAGGKKCRRRRLAVWRLRPPCGQRTTTSLKVSQKRRRTEASKQLSTTSPQDHNHGTE